MSVLRLGFGAKLWNVLFDPRKTFANVGSNHEWVIIWLILSVGSLAAYQPMKPIIKQSQMAQFEEQMKKNEGMTAEQKQQIRDRMESQFDNPIWQLVVPVAELIMIVLVGGILMFLGNIILGGNTSYRQMLNAYAWTTMLAIPGWLVTVPLVLARGSMDVSIGLGALTSAETGVFIKTLLTKFELFGLWQVWLSSVAVSVLANVRAGKAFVAVFVTWFIWVVMQSGLATLGIRFGM
ncbi:MAG: YIP1 family protein [candidate division Zixibacteria bacterium]|nr:YIP1 family protein [candidate division Zixibacteria bacterium]